MSDRVDSTSDERTKNNVMRHEYRVLTGAEKVTMQRIKDLGAELAEVFADLSQTDQSSAREYAIAITKTQEAVMWGVNGLTK